MDITENGALGSANADGTLARGIVQAGAGAHSTIDKFTEAARPAVDRMASGAHQAVDKVAGVATQAAESLGVKGDQLKEAQDRMIEGITGYMKANPVASLGVAVAAGFVLSRLMSSR
jgi:ElaB/YqjD/DUF883 family membrane-anchored ribosome-binding protein